jgi:hypothetical protein
VNTKVHYLRTTNPVNLENLAVYPNRLPTNRPNPYQKPGAFRDLKDGLPVFEDRQCTNAIGSVPFIGGLLSQLTAALPSSLTSQVDKVLGTAASAIAPPCRKQGPFTNADGTQTQFPQVVQSTGAIARARRARAAAARRASAERVAREALRRTP